MKKLIKIVGLLVVGIVISTNALAYYVSGGIIYDKDNNPVAGTYTYDGHEGYIGNVHLGLPDPGAPEPYIGTHALVTNPTDLTSQSSYIGNPAAILSPGGDIDWYKFSVNSLDSLSAFYEWNDGVTALKITFYSESNSDDDEFFSRELTNTEIEVGFLDDIKFKDFPAGEWLMKIEGAGTVGGANGYRVRLVPLPPAALLFVSALAGFGVIGRKKSRSA